ncbi:hypothetical protein J989_2446 [Acinetobacter baumannii 45075_3]|nr:hypothetical protein F976_02393 [Acinetobacter baumannii NIPH 1734]EXC51511.1 hypothetical protein J470_3497 [Acinetobacter baumannii 1032241]EXC97474.1 hypothetical protein J495_3258 [Acinetobacter baumannii 1075025]EXE50468.1 hypothetical protein J575_2635 [Acinetobacter baumannii 43926]EXE83784.1 hypothetical protein J590_2151 [Acinetobacter baumannii 42887]EYD42113.1 hypothetical protein J918_3462 [Acinetobacter baumannii 25493_5]EYD44161.1 hypothetical protein J919_2319 [Acinetobacter
MLEMAKEKEQNLISLKIVKLFQTISISKVNILMAKQGFITTVIIIIRRI